jgi:hypothetical protein
MILPLAGNSQLHGRQTLLVVSSSDAPALAASKGFGGAIVTSPEALNQAVSEYKALLVLCSDTSKYFSLDMSLLAQCLDRLRPGGCVLAHLDGLSKDEASQLETTGLFAGAAESLVEQVPSHNGKLYTRFSCVKPVWASGAASGLSSVDRIDEEALLGEVPRPVGQGKSDCSSKPKACANCSCGRKELEDKVGADEAKKKLEQGTVRSSCNNCYLGDAFRCDGCPYRGLPAFKPGAKVELSSGETEGTGQLGMKVGGEGEVKEGTGGKLVINMN